MRFSHSFMALAAFATLSTASPTPPAGEGFNVEQVETGRLVQRNGALQIQRTLKKFGAPVPIAVKVAAASATQSGVVGATPVLYDREYLSPVQIGTPAQTLMLDFDTGSADLWVYSGKLKAKTKAGHSVYQIRNSKTAKLMSGSTWAIHYGDGSGASGIVYSDQVVIGGVTATSQAVEAATSVSASFAQDVDNDGLVGLGASSINMVSPNQVTTFFDTVKSSLPLPLFTANLKRNASGTYSFGFVNASEYSGSITYTAISFANGYWEFNAGGYAVGSTTYSIKLDTIADTGTTLIYMPDSVLTNYYSQISGSSNSASAGGYIFPCSATPPTFSVKIGGVLYAVPGAYMNYAPYDSTNCYGSLQSSAGLGINIVGDVFLKSVFAVFDQGNSKIGFASKA